MSIDHNVPHAKYHERKIGVVSKSILDLIDRSPAHYKQWIDDGVEERTPALVFGAAFHCALLEPERYAVDYAVEPDFGDCRKTANKAARDSWRSLHENAEHIAADDAKTIENMVAAVRRHPLASRAISDGQSELTLRWTDEDSGLPCKARADYYVEHLGAVFDVKSTLDARPRAFARDVVNYRYHVQDALYRAAFAANRVEVRHFAFVCVEKDPPHAIAIYELDADAVAKGDMAARSNITTMKYCVSSGQWPGYAESIQTIQLPPWAA